MTIELKNASKTVRGITHIKPTSLILETGHFNVLLGQTGSGKTSLIKLMAGLDPLADGQIFMEGQDVSRLSTQKRNISLVHQFFVNYPHMTVFDNIASPLRVAGMAKSEIEGRVQEAADILQLAPMLKRRPQELSGGQQQRAAIARALAMQIAETDRTTMTRLRDLIATSQEVGFSEGMANEVSLFDTHISGVSPTQVGENRAKVTARGQEIAAKTGEQRT